MWFNCGNREMTTAVVAAADSASCCHLLLQVWLLLCWYCVFLCVMCLCVFKCGCSTLSMRNVAGTLLLLLLLSLPPLLMLVLVLVLVLLVLL